MPKAERLPSGNYRVRAQKTVNGKKYNESFTAETKAEAEFLAAQWKVSKKEEAKTENITFDKAIDAYIESRSNILSPSTIRGYRTIQRNAIEDIRNLKLKEISSEVIQKLINRNANRYSQKSLNNQLGLISGVLSDYNISIKVKLPPKEKKDYIVPSENDMRFIIRAIRDSKYELQILFALLLGLRQSEIAALKWENLKGNKIIIHGAIVPNEYHQLVEKKVNKSYASARTLTIPDYLLEKLNAIKQPRGRIFTSNPDTVRKEWRKILAKYDLPPFRIHDLRHANAAMMLLLNIPDLYAMERLGQSSPQMIKQVYQYTFDDEHKAIDANMNRYINEKLIPNCHENCQI